MQTDPYFAGKIAVVTGGASGIGKALCSALASRGAKVVVGDLDEQGAKQAADQLSSATGSTVVGTSVDVTDFDAVDDLVKQTVSEHGRIDLMFNNAGIAVFGEVKDMTTAHFEKAMSVLLNGVVHGVLAAYPIMIGQRDGHIVNTASLAGLLPSPILTPYSTAKHAVVGLTKGLRPEAAQHGVRVSVICPGVIDTPLLDKQNPLDIPPIPTMPNGREMLTRLAKAYPPNALAEDVLAGIKKNKCFIVAPRHARAYWTAFRIAPELSMRLVTKSMGRFTQK